jgi:hypothetical protein
MSYEFDLIRKYEKVRALYEAEYEFKFCGLEDIDRTLEFIDQHWQHNHILTRSRELLDWQHLDTKNRRYNFVLAIHRKTNEIHGLVGFIMSSIYDSGIESPIRWGAIWKIREDIGARGLGIGLKWFLYTHAEAPYLGGIGLSRYSREINTKLGEEVGKLNLYYMLNASRKAYRLVEQYDDVSFPCVDVTSAASFRQLTERDFAKEINAEYLKRIPPYKSHLYYINRYFKHPIYKYYFTKITDESFQKEACFVWRFCEHQEDKCIVIVDYIGNGEELSGHYHDFQKLLITHNAEYISFFNLGIDDRYLIDAGFQDRKASNIIIPVYYEPFVMKNVELDYHYDTVDQTFVNPMIFKGDADQDRPNYIPVKQE